MICTLCTSRFFFCAGANMTARNANPTSTISTTPITEPIIIGVGGLLRSVIKLLHHTLRHKTQLADLEPINKIEHIDNPLVL